MFGIKFSSFIVALAAALSLCARSDAQLTLGSPVATVTVHAFSGQDGANPNSSLLLGSDGALYGVSFSGGANNAGVVYRVTTGGVETVLHSFGGSGDGSNPSGALVQTSSGEIYGTTIHGGAHGSGTIYSITMGGTYSSIYSFTGNADGSEPYAGLTLGSNNTLYGVTFLGGSGSGTLFSCTTGGTLTTLYSFSALEAEGINSDGAMPYGALVKGSDGSLYGTTTVGGANGTGVIYRVSSSNVFSVIHTFAAIDANGDSTEGADPYAGLVAANDGNLYGATYSGGVNGTGAIFRVSTSGSYATLYSFSALTAHDNADGANPSAGLIQATDGNLYGVAGFGGSNGSGELFSISLSGTFTSVYSFPALALSNSVPGAARPYSSVLQGAGGVFYLSGYYGGSGSSGAVLTIAQHTFPAGLQLFSVPFDYTGTPLSGVLNVASPIVADWLPATSEYAETPTVPADTLHQGSAYWARFPAPVSMASAAGDLAAGKSTFSISLTAGWNMVGDPFSSATPITSVTVIDAQNQSHTWLDATALHLIAPVFYSYNLTSNTYVLHVSDSLQPYSGYWMQAFRNVTLQIPRPNGT